MLYRDICRILGFFILGFSSALFIPFLLAAYYEFIANAADHPQPHTTIHFFEAIAISMGIGFILTMIGRNASGHLFRREGVIAVVLIWFITPAIAALPFYLSDTLKTPVQAYFESAAGFTTTGSTTMHAKKFDATNGKEIPYEITWLGVRDTTYYFFGNIDPVRDPLTGEIIHEGIEAVSKALLFWRSFIQYLGGVGIVVLFVAILPALGVGGKVLFQAEVPGPIKDALTPRIKETAIQLCKIYLGLSLLQIIILVATNPALGWLDVFTITFSTMSTGGYSIRNSSIAAYNNAGTEGVIIIFMILGGVNFSLYYFAIKGRLYRIYDRELMLFLAILFVECCIVVWKLVGTDKIVLNHPDVQGVFGWGDAIRYGVFQLVSAHTSTGFTTANYDIWPYLVQAVMLISMFFGAMSGSTAGGMKTIRIYMLFKIAQHKVESLFRPETVRAFKLGERSIDAGAATLVLCFFLTITAVSVLGVLVYVANEIDLETSIGLVACMVNNTGISFRMAGPTQSCAFLTDFSLAWSAFLMILGRLEFFAVLALLVPAFWKQNS